MFTQKILEIVQFVVSSLKEKKSFDVQNLNLVEVIKNMLDLGSIIGNG